MSVLEPNRATNQDNFTVSSDQLSFRFANLCGSPYKGGSVVFSSDGTTLFSPVSNRVQTTDLSSNRSWVCQAELRSTADLIVPMPVSSSKAAKLVLGVDVDGYGLLFERDSGVVLNRINFKGRVNAATFSKDGKYLATSTGRRIKVWHSASVENNWQFVLMHQFAGHIGDVSSLEFSNCNLLLLSAGSDSIVRVWSLADESSAADKDNSPPRSILTDHTQSIVGAYFHDGTNAVVAVNRAGSILVWKKEAQQQGYEVVTKAHIPAGVGYVTSASFDSFSGLLCLGLSGGIFSLFSLTTSSIDPVQSLSVGSSVSSVSLAQGGDWVAVGVEETGQLIVWEWRAENFIFRQQGHHDGVNCVAFCSPNRLSSSSSPDLLDLFSGRNTSSFFTAGGGLVATGGVEGKVKLWHSQSGFCFVTFSDHTSSVEALVFTPQGNAVVSASMDGSVRAYDLLRYKNFRTFAAPDARVQFGSLAMDPSGEMVAAGSANGNYSIYLWSMQTGQCLEIFSGHEARVSHLRFAPSGNDGILASCSWDSSFKIWDIFARKAGNSESLINQREVTCSAFDPVDGTIAAVATLSGHITFWDTRNGAEVGSIDAIRDIGSGRREGERFSTGALKGKKSKRDGTGLGVNLNQYFTAMEYGGAAGRWLVAVSNRSVFACIYDPLEKVLIARIELTTHWGLDGVHQFLNSKFDSELVQDDPNDDGNSRSASKKRKEALPGVVRGDMKIGHSSSVWRVNGLAVAVDGQEMAVATSEGAFLLQLGKRGGFKMFGGFNPTDLSQEVCTGAVITCLEKSDFFSACKFSLQLNDSDSFKAVFDRVNSVEDIHAVVASIPPSLLLALLRQISLLVHPVDGSREIEKTLIWLAGVIKLQFNSVQKMVHESAQGREIKAIICSLLQHIQTQSSALGTVLRQNSFALSVLNRRGGRRRL